MRKYIILEFQQASEDEPLISQRRPDLIQSDAKVAYKLFNGKSLPIPYEWKEKIDDWISKMGYHFMIEYFKYS